MYVTADCEGKMTKDTVPGDTQKHENQPDNGRGQHVRNWLAQKVGKWAGRGVAGGLGSTLLALPVLAQATDAELDAYQFADAIPGVQSAKLLPNGDVLLKLADGRSAVVAAENVRILPNGAVMIADAAAAEISQFAVAAEAGGAAAGGASGAGAVLGGVGLAGAAAAGGGGGGGDEGAEDVTTQSLPGLNLASAQSGGLSSTSARHSAPDRTASVEVTIGSVTKTIAPAPDGSWSLTLTPAEAAGLPQGKTTVTIRNLDAGGTEISVETAKFSVDTVPPSIAITGFSDGAVMNAAEQGTDLAVSGTSDAENGQTVTVMFNGQAYTGKVSGGQWTVDIPASDLAALTDGSTVSVTADVDDRAGNPAPQATSSFDTDFSAPDVTLNPVAGGSIELIDVTSDLVLTGTTTAEDGQVVTVVFAGQSYTGAASGGTWSVTVPVADLSGLSTGTPVSVSASVSDAAGNPATPVTASVPVDLTGPSIAIDALSVGAVLNAAETASDLTVSGTTDNVTDGQIVSVTLNGTTYTAAVSGGVWSVTVPTADLAALTDGGDFTVTADITDADGLVAPQAGVALSKDATPPALSVDGISAGAIMNAAEKGSDLTITGSTTAEDGQVVSVTLNGQTYTASAASGSWSITAPASDIAALADASTYTVTANVADAAGNPAVPATSSFDTDFTAPSLSISALSDGSVMNAAEQATDLTVSGTSNAADGTLVTIEIARADGTVDVSGSAVVTGGAWTYTASAASISGLSNNEVYSVNAAIADAAGNGATASAGFSTDFTAPSLTLNALPIGSVLDVVEKDSDLAISGTTTAEDGQTVSVSLGGNIYTASVSGGSWSTTVSSTDLAALSDSTGYVVTASVADTSGNAAPDATLAFTTDFRPVLAMDDVGTNASISLEDAQAGGYTVSGTSYGLNTGQAVAITLNSVLVGSATVGSDGSWSLPVSSLAFVALDAGDAINFTAQATVLGGPDPDPVSDQATAHVPAAYTITEIGRSGSTVTFEVHAAADRDTSGGLAVTAELGFDPSVITYDAGSDAENDDFDLFLANQISGSAVSFAGAATSFGDISEPVVTFTMTIQDSGQPVVLTITTPDGGPTTWQMGTDGADTLTATDVDDMIQGGDGDDIIDLDSGGRDAVIFEADPAANGVDTITGFTLGAATDISDAILFSGLDASTLRGTGLGFEKLAFGDAIDTDTGFVGLTSILADLDAGTLAQAAESLNGAQTGDEIFMLASDGSDSLLVKVTYTDPDTASVENVAQFTGLSDLSDLHADNVLHTDPTGASV